MAEFDNQRGVDRGKRCTTKPSSSSQCSHDPLLLCGKAKSSMRSFLRSELSATTRVRMVMPPRTQSAKGRLETTRKSNSPGNQTRNNKDSEFAQSKRSVRRPSTGIPKSGAVSKSNFHRPSHAWTTNKADEPKEVQKTEAVTEMENVTTQVLKMIKKIKAPPNKYPEIRVRGQNIPRPSTCPVPAENKKPPPENEKAPLAINDNNAEKKKCIMFSDEVQVCEESRSTESFDSNIGCFLTEAFEQLDNIIDNSKNSCKTTSSKRQEKSEHFKGSAWGTENREHRQNTVQTKGKHSQACSEGIGKKSNIKICTYNLEIHIGGEGDERESQAIDEVDSFPYKMEKREGSPVCKDVVLSEVEEVCTSHLGRELPKSLKPLQDFICKPDDTDCKKVKYLTGVDPKDCLIFLPGLNFYDIESMSEVPSIQHVDDDLPYIEKLSTPKPWMPKKYPYLYKPAPVPKWQCCHGSTSFIDKGRSKETKRTIDVVRQECTHLENLLKDASNCVISLYQADIAKLQSTLSDTLGKIPHRCRTPPEHPETEADQFGLRKFYKEHEVIIEQIRRQHAHCVQELATLEEEAQLKESERYFSKQNSEAASPETVSRS